ANAEPTPYKPATHMTSRVVLSIVPPEVAHATTPRGRDAEAHRLAVTRRVDLKSRRAQRESSLATIRRSKMILVVVRSATRDEKRRRDADPSDRWTNPCTYFDSPRATLPRSAD